MDEIRLSASTAGDELSPSTSAAIRKAREKLDDKPVTHNLSGAQGVIIGDNAQQTNNFG
ncbi:hypothetical protein ACWEIJ_19535 [Lentzea sp. NPDC004789]